MRLEDFLRDAATHPFVWGKQDCALFVANWVRVCTGKDAAGALRWAYSSQEEAERLIADSGSLHGLIEELASAAGLHKTSTLVEGDVAVVTVRGEEVCAIRSRSGWVFARNRGVTRIQHVEVLCAWSVGYGG